MRMCNTCGVEAVDPETGECTYCPGHIARQKSEGAKPGKAAKGAK